MYFLKWFPNTLPIFLFIVTFFFASLSPFFPPSLPSSHPSFLHGKSGGIKWINTLFGVYISTHHFVVFFLEDLLFSETLKTYAIIFFFPTCDLNCTIYCFLFLLSLSQVIVTIFPACLFFYKNCISL